jgi:hypothetical protein
MPVPPAPTPYVPVQPTYKSISGKAYHDTAFTEYIVCSNGVTAQVNGYLCNIVSGTYVDGCDCTVYYTQYADGSYEITSVDIYGVYNPYLIRSASQMLPRPMSAPPSPSVTGAMAPKPSGRVTVPGPAMKLTVPLPIMTLMVI